MSEMNDSDLFKALILNFQMSAMLGMGKIMNPITQKTERNMEEAKRAIDFANMLANKTKGNLSDDEEKFMNQVLTELRLNYVHESSKPVEDMKEDTIEKEENVKLDKNGEGETKIKKKKVKSK